MGDEATCATDGEVEELLEGVIREEGLRDYKIEQTVGAVKGDGYIGIITNVIILGKNKDEEDKVVHLVVKRASKNDALRNELPVIAAFRREIYMYNTVFPAFKELEARRAIEPSTFIPKFYEGSMTDKHETVILENLRRNEYRMYERRLPMDEDHVSLALIEYGKFHALSFALQDQNPEEFERIIANMDNLAVKIFKENFLLSLQHRCAKILEKLNTQEDQEMHKTFKAFSELSETYLNELSKTADDHSVVLHGDCWTNNMMFKYDDAIIPTVPTKVCFIDFQLSSIGSPVLDLAMFFYSCSSKQIIDQLHYYMQLYYKSLSDYLQILGSDPDKVYPYSLFQQQWKTYARYGLLVAVINIHAMLTEDDEAIDLKDSAESGGVSSAFNYEICKVDEYNDRIKHIIAHFIKHDYF